jgi:Xaa-Pro dipeptidase
MKISRRTILRTAGIGSILPIQGNLWALGDSSQTAQRIPPSIAALQSMRAQAQPISVEERGKRIEKAQRLMVEQGMDAILLAGGASLLYFTGVRWGNSERLFAVVIPAKGHPFCVCPSFEEDRAREQLDRGPLKSVQVMTWQEDESPYNLLVTGLRSLSKLNGVLGIEERTP